MHSYCEANKFVGFWKQYALKDSRCSYWLDCLLFLFCVHIPGRIKLSTDVFSLATHLNSKTRGCKVP